MITQPAEWKAYGMDEFDPIAYINEPRWQQVRPGLGRITELLERMGKPQDRLHFIHVAGTNGQLKAYDGWTSKFIFPPYNFTVANSFFVNFYMPQSSQLLMVAAFAGYEETMHAYEVAVKEGYHFGDYGDAMLIVD